MENTDKMKIVESPEKKPIDNIVASAYGQQSSAARFGISSTSGNKNDRV